MIYLLQNQQNQVILELTCNSSLLSPNYLFEFTNVITPSNVTYFTAQDLSTFGCRYNRFLITESGTTAPLSGTISLRSGNYNYRVFESTGVTLSVSATTGVVIDTGKVVVHGNDEFIINPIYR